MNDVTTKPPLSNTTRVISSNVLQCLFYFEKLNRSLWLEVLSFLPVRSSRGGRLLCCLSTLFPLRNKEETTVDVSCFHRPSVRRTTNQSTAVGPFVSASFTREGRAEVGRNLAAELLFFFFFFLLSLKPTMMDFQQHTRRGPFRHVWVTPVSAQLLLLSLGTIQFWWLSRSGLGGLVWKHLLHNELCKNGFLTKQFPYCKVHCTSTPDMLEYLCILYTDHIHYGEDWNMFFIRLCRYGWLLFDLTWIRFKWKQNNLLPVSYMSHHIFILFPYPSIYSSSCILTRVCFPCRHTFFILSSWPAWSSQTLVNYRGCCWQPF